MRRETAARPAPGKKVATPEQLARVHERVRALEAEIVELRKRGAQRRLQVIELYNEVCYLGGFN